MIQPYVMAMCQPTTQTIFGEGGALRPEVLDANVEHYCDLIARAARDHDAKLIAFPQFGLCGYAPGLTLDNWVDASLTFPGPHLDRIGQAAKAAGAHVVVQATERHDAFPGRYFISACLIKPDGSLGLVYRKHYAISTRTSPVHVLDAFVAEFGQGGLFPVADTPLGRIGVVIGAEVHWPEGVRSLALNGAEIIINPVAASPVIDYMGRAGAALTRPVRAFENMVYLGMPNMGVTVAAGAAATEARKGPCSQIWDYDGELIATAPNETDAFALATIDIEALRRARAKPTANFLAQLQPIHDDPGLPDLWPANTFAAARVEQYGELTAVEAAAWRRMQDAGRAVGPTDQDQ